MWELFPLLLSLEMCKQQAFFAMQHFLKFHTPIKIVATPKCYTKFSCLLTLHGSGEPEVLQPLIKICKLFRWQNVLFYVNTCNFNHLSLSCSVCFLEKGHMPKKAHAIPLGNLKTTQKSFRPKSIHVNAKKCKIANQTFSDLLEMIEFQSMTFWSSSKWFLKS